MEQVIYGDTLFLVNSCMDFLALFFTCRILYRPIRIGRCVLAAVMGGIYGVASLFLPGNLIIGTVLHIAMAAILCAVGVGADRDLWRSTVLFYTVSLVLGGVMTVLFSRFNRFGRRSIFYNGTVVTVQSEISPIWFFLFALIATLGAWVAGKVFRREITKRRVTVCAVLFEREITFDALADSGNLVCDPLGGRPAVFTSYDVLKGILPDELKAVFSENRPDLLPCIAFSLARRVRMIPARGIGREGVLCALIPDNATVDGVAHDICLVCAQSGEAGNTFGGCHGLVPVSLLH